MNLQVSNTLSVSYKTALPTKLVCKEEKQASVYKYTNKCVSKFFKQKSELMHSNYPMRRTLNINVLEFIKCIRYFDVSLE